MLEQSFSEQVRVISFNGTKYLSQIKCDKYYLKGEDKNKNRISLPKIEVLFAFARENMSAVKPFIKKITPLKNQHLQPVEVHTNRFQIADKLLTQVKESNSKVKVVTRSGNVVRGLIKHFDKTVLYMLVGEKDVVVFRHGL